MIVLPRERFFVVVNWFEELLERMGKLKAQIPWLRVFVEGVVIVGSILLALGIHDRQGRGLNVSLNVRMR